MQPIPSDCENYTRCLLPLGQGYPLWMPKPNDSLSKEYIERGVDIGDIGLVTENGSFDFLWSTCLPADHAINRGRTPPDHMQIDLDLSMDISSHEMGRPVGSYIASAWVEKKIAIERPSDNL